MTSNEKRKFVKAEDGPDHSVIYTDDMGNKYKKYWKKDPNEEPSSRAWRNNNPGNLQPRSHAKSHGMIGSAGGWAVFPDYRTGREALRTLLRTSVYIDLTLHNLPKKYTGVDPKNPDTDESIQYRKDIQTMTQFDMQRTIRSLSTKEYEQLLDAMERHEGWNFGHEGCVEVKKITGIHLNKQRAIFEFLVEDSSSKIWISKEEAINLAKEGMLRAVVVKGKNTVYLRPEYHQISFKQLVC